MSVEEMAALAENEDKDEEGDANEETFILPIINSSAEVLLRLVSVLIFSHRSVLINRVSHRSFQILMTRYTSFGSPLLFLIAQSLTGSALYNKYKAMSGGDDADEGEVTPASVQNETLEMVRLNHLSNELGLIKISSFLCWHHRFRRFSGQVKWPERFCARVLFGKK